MTPVSCPLGKLLVPKEQSHLHPELMLPVIILDRHYVAMILMKLYLLLYRALQLFVLVNHWVEENLWIVHEAALVWLKRPYVRFMDFFARKQKGPSLYLVFVLCLQICNSRSLGWLCPSTSRRALGGVKFLTVMRLYGEWTICIDALMT